MDNGKNNYGYSNYNNNYNNSSYIGGFGMEEEFGSKHRNYSGYAKKSYAPKNKSRSLLSILMGFILCVVLTIGSITLSLRLGIFGGDNLEKVVNQAISMKELKIEVVGLTSADSGSAQWMSASNIYDECLNYIKDICAAGKMPPAEEFEAKIKGYIDQVYSLCAEYVVLEAKEKYGSITSDNIEKLKTFDAVKNLIGNDNIGTFKNELSIKYSGSIKIKGVGQENTKAKLVEIMKSASGVDESIDEFIEDDYSNIAGEEFEAINLERPGDIAALVSEAGATTVTVILVIMAIIAVGLIIVIAVIDKNKYITTKGLMLPLLIPGIINMLVFIMISAVISSASSGMNKHLKRLLDAAVSGIFRPFIFVGIALFLIAIVLRMVGMLMESDD